MSCWVTLDSTLQVSSKYVTVVILNALDRGHLLYTRTVVVHLLLREPRQPAILFCTEGSQSPFYLEQKSVSRLFIFNRGQLVAILF